MKCTKKLAELGPQLRITENNSEYLDLNRPSEDFWLTSQLLTANSCVPHETWDWVVHLNLLLSDSMLGLVHMIPILENIFRKDRKYILLRRVKGSRLCSLQARLKARGNNLQHNQKFTLQKINVWERNWIIFFFEICLCKFSMEFNDQISDSFSYILLKTSIFFFMFDRISPPVCDWDPELTGWIQLGRIYVDDMITPCFDLMRH